MSEDEAALPPLASATDLVMSDQQRLDYASARIRGYCRWHIYPSITETRKFDSNGGRLLMLPTLLLTDVASITLTRTGAVVDPAAYSKSRLGMVELLSDHHWPSPGQGWAHAGHPGWPIGFETVTVTFTHGYAEVPLELQEIALSIGSRMAAQLRSVDQETVDQVGSRTYGAALAGGFSSTTGLTIAETTVLDRYRLQDRG